MAIGIHIVRTAFKAVNPTTGQPIDKESPTTTIGQVLRTEHRHVVIPSDDVPNSAGYPSIEAYLKLEANGSYVLRHIDQNMIVTYQGL